MSKLTYYIESTIFNTWIVRNPDKTLAYIGLNRTDAIKWAFAQNKEDRRKNTNEK